MNVKVLIPARGGSKTIKGKNIVDINGFSLISYSITAALASKADEVWVSTNEAAIADVSRECGARIIIRPNEICKDDSPTEDAVGHFLSEVKCDVVVLMQATSPMVAFNDIDRGIEKYISGGYDSLFSAVRPEDMLIWNRDRMEPINYQYKDRGFRQNRDRNILIESGSFYIFSREFFMESRCRLGGKIGYIEVPFWRSFQVDSLEDLTNLAKLMKGEKC